MKGVVTRRNPSRQATRSGVPEESSNKNPENKRQTKKVFDGVLMPPLKPPKKVHFDLEGSSAEECEESEDDSSLQPFDLVMLRIVKAIERYHRLQD